MKDTAEYSLYAKIRLQLSREFLLQRDFYARLVDTVKLRQQISVVNVLDWFLLNNENDM